MAFVFLALAAAAHAGPLQSLLPAHLDEIRPWAELESGTRAHLAAICFADATHGWAVGDKGTILATDDGGHHWQAQSSATQQGLTAVAFASLQQGVAVGEKGTMLWTGDGGATWSAAQVPPTSEELRAVCFVGPGRVLACGDKGVVLVSQDGGRTWSRSIVPGEVPLNAMVSGGGKVVAVGGKSVVYETRFGRYVDVFSRLTQKRQPSEVLVSADQGATWARQELSTKVPLFAVSVSGQSAWAVGGDVRYGRDWLKGKVASFGYPAVMASRDGGTTWVEQHLDEHFKGSLLDVRFLDEREGWAVGFEHQPPPPLIPIPFPMDVPDLAAYFHTTDGGQTWTREQPLSSPLLHKVFFLDAMHAWGAGPNGAIVRYEPTWYATWLYNQHKYVEALETLSHLAQDDPDVKYLRTLLLARQGSDPGKLADGLEAAGDPHRADVQYLLAALRYEAGQPELSRQRARAATELDRDHAEAFYLQGLLYLDAQQPHLAAPYLQRYLLLKPDGPLASDARRKLAGP